jgi:hypothetical protein
MELSVSESSLTFQFDVVVEFDLGSRDCCQSVILRKWITILMGSNFQLTKQLGQLIIDRVIKLSYRISGFLGIIWRFLTSNSMLYAKA